MIRGSDNKDKKIGGSPSAGSRPADAKASEPASVPGPADTMASNTPSRGSAATRGSSDIWRFLDRPSVGTKRKIRYPGAEPTGINTQKEASFNQALGKRLREQLPEGQSLATLSPGRHAAGLANEANLLAELGEAKEQLTQLGVPAARIEQALKTLPSNELATLLQAEAQQRKLSGTNLQDKSLEKAVQHAQAKLDRTMPVWASQNSSAHTVLQKAQRLQLRLQGVTARNNRQVRAVLVHLDGDAMAKLPHFAKGSFGKVSRAMRADGTLRALKTLRLDAAGGRGVTQASTREEAEQEVAFMKRFYDPTTRLVLDEQTQKLTIDMPLALGAMLDLPRDGTVSVSDLARSAGRQVMAGLARMHAEAALHNDMKTGNINVHADGRICPADFGKANYGPAKVATEEFGAPEFFLPDPEPQQGVKPEPFNHQAPDVWSAGLALADWLVPIEASPFAAQRLGAMTGAHMGFMQWREQIKPHMSGGMQRLREAPADDSFTDYFQSVQKADPEVCEHLLTSVLVPVADRASAAKSSEFFAGLQPADSNAEQRLKGQLGALEDSPQAQASNMALKLRLQAELRTPKKG